MNPSNPWRRTPRKSRIVFLVAVFCVFASFGFANDITSMGREPTPRFIAAVFIAGGFAVGYATIGFILRGQFWKAFLPLLAVHLALMVWLSNRFPDAPQPSLLTAAQLDHLHSRLAFGAIAIIFLVSLGYSGFVYASISEARRHLRDQAQKALLESEMAAAREIQRVMVPENLPAIPGYTLESVYRPAAEVGGDFFQVIPQRSGSTIVVIGDVSGKGLRAAMIVSMIVGALRTVSTYTEEPAEILSELNRILCGRAQGGFATCLIARLEDSGQLIIANAGHPSPYLNAVEVPFGGSFPLGLVENAAYAQTSLEMHRGDVVVLLTDGVAEAQNEQRVLLGFSRVESLLGEGATAVAVADTAQQHGQNDDLTVISIQRAAMSSRLPEHVLSD